MKLIVLSFLFGCAISSPIHNSPKALENDVGEVYQDFMADMDDTGAFPLHSDNIKDEIGNKLKDALYKVLERMKDAVEQGKAVGEDLQNKFKEIREKLKELKIDMGSKARGLLDKIKERTRDFIKNLLDKLGEKRKTKRFVEDSEIQMLDFNLKELLRELKKELLENNDDEELKAAIEKLFGKESDVTKVLEDFINKKGAGYREILLDVIDRFLDKEIQFAEQHSITDYWQKLKDYFKDLKIDLQEKYMKFGEWVKKYAKDAVSNGKTKIDNIKEIANEFLKNTKDVSREVAIEALDFLRPYQKDLGNLYEQVKNQVKDILMNRD